MYVHVCMHVRVCVCVCVCVCAAVKVTYPSHWEEDIVSVGGANAMILWGKQTA